MEKREYIDSLVEQIRCKKARNMIVEEIDAHIEDQIEALEIQGMDRENAIKESIRQMGDPVKTGLELDRIHRPKVPWSFLMMVVVLTVAGSIIQMLLMMHIGKTEKILYVFLYSLLGIMICLGVLYVDYTIIGKYALYLWVGITLWMIIWNVQFRLNPQGYSVHQTISGSLTIAIPFYAGVIFRFREKRFKGIILSLVLLIPICWVGLTSSTATSGLEVSLSCLVMISIAIGKGWYGKKTKISIPIIWLPVIGIPGFVLIDVFFFAGRQTIFAEYQMMRLMAFFNPAKYADSISYKTFKIQTLLANSSLLGGKHLLNQELDVICNEYIITSIFSYFGILTGVVTLFVTGIIVIKAFHISIHQRNRLGYLVGVGCSMSLAIKMSVYVATNLGIGFFLQTSMPFLSYGLKYTIVNAVTVGILLSVYRNSEILSEKACCHIRRKKENTV